MIETKIFLDGADQIIQNANNDLISGYTTNPSLLRKAGVASYETFARQVLEVITDKPVSFEVLSDYFDIMHRQALKIASWGKNVAVKIPITNSKGESSLGLIAELITDGVTVNVTAITLLGQVIPLLPAMNKAKKGFISMFAGRIADCGTDPEPIMRKAVQLIEDECPHIELIWASAREIFNVIQADRSGCDIITIGSDLLKKYPLIGKSLKEMSLDTVKMFARDAEGYTL